ncbi:unnamed protein product [marine sediment metagenome]|uniref:Glycosyltransferase 2-like domain-containing protein n=1 Tax=marine sediment metagenome TaxID=412755 RepID=X1TB22_9ZZZZ
MKQVYDGYAHNDPRVKIDYTDVANKDRWTKTWVAVVTNKALFQLCEGEPYVTWTADDVCVHPKKLEILVKFLENHPNESMVAGQLQMYDRKGKVLNTLGGKTYKSASCMLDWVQPMMRRMLIDKVGRLQEYPFTVLLDARYWTSIARLGVHACGIPLVLDKMPSYTKQTCKIPAKRAKGLAWRDHGVMP